MMNKSSYKTYDDLPLMLSVPDVAKVLGISRAGAYELAHSRAFPTMKVVLHQARNYKMVG